VLCLRQRTLVGPPHCAESGNLGESYENKNKPKRKNLIKKTKKHNEKSN